jgi:hypothetical protein
MNTEQRTYPELDAAIAALPLTYTATFVPQSVSRNAGEKHRTINWRIALTPGKVGAPVHDKKPVLCDYSQGIGHIPKNSHIRPHTNDAHAQEYEASEKGRYFKGSSGWLTVVLPPPNVRDVFYSLVLDASVLNCDTFEEWAADYGYDTDSRAAEDTYRTCLAQSRAFVALIGTQALRQLETLFQDY